MLSYYNNQLCFLGNNFLRIYLSISVIYIGIWEEIRALYMHTSSCKINKLKEIEDINYKMCASSSEKGLEML